MLMEAEALHREEADKTSILPFSNARLILFRVTGAQEPVPAIIGRMVGNTLDSWQSTGLETTAHILLNTGPNQTFTKTFPFNKAVFLFQQSFYVHVFPAIIQSCVGV